MNTSQRFISSHRMDMTCLNTAFLLKFSQAVLSSASSRSADQNSPIAQIRSLTVQQFIKRRCGSGMGGSVIRSLGRKARLLALGGSDQLSELMNAPLRRHGLLLKQLSIAWLRFLSTVRYGSTCLPWTTSGYHKRLR